ncbi:GntR family transcriptional regulator [Streptomyces sp. NPDC058284]|uniref:GntR family transcriptional regulator n=1 Tax=unclassified Streptomyces TaxID=2593676 RepID=UPI003668F668
MTDLHDLPQETLRRLPKSARAPALQLYAVLLGEIRSGELAPGRVITYAELVSRHRANCVVVSGALQLLRHDGLVETRPRLGTRIVVEGETWAVPGQDEDMPLAVYVEKEMRRRLAGRVYPPDTRIPILALLAEEFGVSVMTVRTGLSPLFDAGFLITKGHKQDGTKVTRRVDRTPRADLLTLAERPADLLGKLYPAWGEAKTLADWSRDKRCAVPYGTLKARIIDHGWPVKRAITTPRRTRP